VTPSGAVGDLSDLSDLSDLPDYVVLYDGVCGLCNKAVRSLLGLDQEKRLHFAALQGETAARLGIAWDADGPAADATFRFVDGRGGTPVITERMDAAVAALGAIDRLPVLRFLLRHTPRVVNDFVYRQIAASRYRLFGKYDECRIPTKKERARFLP